MLAPADGVQEKKGSSRVQIVLATKRSVDFLAIYLAPWRSLTSVYPHSSHSIAPSDFDGSPSAWLRGGTAINHNTYGVTNRLYLSRRMIYRVIRLPKNAPASGVIRRQNENLPTQQRALTSQKGQARRRPVEPPGSSTRVCLDFVLNNPPSAEGGTLIVCPAGTFLDLSEAPRKRKSGKDGPRRYRGRAGGK